MSRHAINIYQQYNKKSIQLLHKNNIKINIQGVAEKAQI